MKTGKLSLDDKLFLVKTKKDAASHIKINKKVCKHCEHKMCLVVCPAKTYEEKSGAIEASYENCLECGSCRVVCTDGAIVWENPRGGFGVTFING
ncbi:MAG: 4Fe-4S dicluster domain-containing protein [Candidatus Omnitrophica bacterium]|nr:4Fe-4S dicluster domain-containing protein [Candidatus Omnitrophota bacterium]